MFLHSASSCNTVTGPCGNIWLITNNIYIGKTCWNLQYQTKLFAYLEFGFFDLLVGTFVMWLLVRFAGESSNSSSVGHFLVHNSTWGISLGETSDKCFGPRLIPPQPSPSLCFECGSLPKSNCSLCCARSLPAGLNAGPTLLGMSMVAWGARDADCSAMSVSLHKSGRRAAQDVRIWRLMDSLWGEFGLIPVHVARLMGNGGVTLGWSSEAFSMSSCETLSREDTSRFLDICFFMFIGTFLLPVTGISWPNVSSDKDDMSIGSSDPSDNTRDFDFWVDFLVFPSWTAVFLRHWCRAWFSLILLGDLGCQNR